MADSTGAVKIREGLYLKDAQAGVSTAVTGINRAVAANPKSSITAGVRSTTGGAEITAINTRIDGLGNNLLMVDTQFLTPKANQTLVHASKVGVASGTVVYTVPNGKTFYCTGATLSCVAAGSAFLQINATGDYVAIARPLSGALGCTNSLSGGILFSATAGQTIDLTGGAGNTNDALIWGWLE